MRRLKILGAALALMVSNQVFASGSQPPTGERELGEYNLQAENLSVKGYDPVSYFAEGGGKAQAGAVEFSTVYMGVRYRFSSQKNLDTFLTNPRRYEPTYGNWCAYAMALNQKVDIDPTLFTISGNRLHLFISTDAKLQFDANIPAFERRADAAWRRFSGEDPRK